MKIGFVLQNDYPHVGEVRARRMGKSLHRSGHAVVFLSWNSRTRPTSEILEYGKVYRFDIFVNSIFFRFIGAPSPLNPFWVWWLCKLVRKENIQVLVISNLRIALPALMAGKISCVPVALDLQENNAELVRFKPKSHWSHVFSRTPFFVGILERSCVQLADAVWVVAEERLASFPGGLRSKRKIKVVHHTIPLDEIVLDFQSSGNKASEFMLIFFGRINGRGKDLDWVLEAISCVVKKDPTIKLKIGGVHIHRDFLSRKLEMLHLSSCVDIEGQIEPENLLAWLGQGHLGLISYPVNSFTNTTISNRLFHFLAAGLPVLSTDMKPTRRILEEYGCGAIIPAHSSPAEVAGIILDLKNNPGELHRMAGRALTAVKEKYHWEKDFKTVLDDLSDLIEIKTDYAGLASASKGS